MFIYFISFLSLFELTNANKNQNTIINDRICNIVFDKYFYSRIYTRNFEDKYGNFWPNGKVYYKLNSKFGHLDKIIIKAALKSIAKGSSIIWIPYVDNSNQSYVYFDLEDNGCHSVLGFDSKRKVHTVNLQRHLRDGRSCIVIGVVLHEVLHALGFTHTHQRPDRDLYIKILWENVNRNLLKDYIRFRSENESLSIPICDEYSNYDNCTDELVVLTYGVKYDYKSILHYPSHFGGQEQIKLLKDVPNGVEVGQRNDLSDIDVMLIKSAYSFTNA